MKPTEIFKKAKESGTRLCHMIGKPFAKKNTATIISSNQFSEVVKDKASRSAQYIKKNFTKLQKMDSQSIVKYALIILLGVYIVVGIVLSVFAYTTTNKGKKPSADLLKVTKRDIWVKKIAKIYPLPAAIVNGNFISMEEFYKQVSYLKTFNNQVPDSLSKEITSESSLRRRVLDNLIETKIIEEQANKNKITVTKTDIDAAYKSAAEANGGAEQIEKVLKNLYGMNPDEFRNLIENQLYREKIREKLLSQVHLAHILVTDQAKADAALARIQKGETFEVVAASASEDSNSKVKGGDIGWMGRDDIRENIDQNFEKTAFALKKGEVSGIIKTKYGYHIVKLIDKKGAIDKSFTDWLDELKHKSKIHRLIKS